MSRGTRAGATIRQLDGKRLLGIARTHAVITDRPVEEGGADTGFTSGELLLLAIGACCTGSLRGYLEAQGRTVRDLEVNVHFEPGAEGAPRDRIVITLRLDPRDYRGDPERIKAAATSGGVASRLMQTSDVEVRFAADHL
jgi:uncharacterized OsmC-like protein